MSIYSRAPYKHDFEQTITTDAEGVAVDRAFLAHYHIPAAKAVAADSDGILPFTDIGAQAKSITDGFTQPAVPRNVQIDGSAANMTGNVKIYGTNFAGAAINETIALDGTTAKDGNLAFASVDKVDLPVQTNTPAKQKATVAVTAGASAAGDSVLTFTAAALDEDSPKDITVTLAAEDNTTAEVAAKIAAALNTDGDFAAHFVAASAEANVTIESKIYAQDVTIDLTVKTAGDPKITVDAIDVDTVAGVAPDQVSIGWGDKFGIPYKLYADELVILKLFNKAVDTGGTLVNSATALESNTFDPNGTPDGSKDIDLYIIV